MASSMSSEAVEAFKNAVKKVEPYPISVLDDLKLDDDRYDFKRIISTTALKRLLDAGYSESEVNPWKKN